MYKFLGYSISKPSNIFLYGKTGTGKTLSMLHVVEKLETVAKNKKSNLKVFYLNCKLKRVADTEYRLIAALARDFGESVPITGLPTDEIYRMFIQKVDQKSEKVRYFLSLIGFDFRVLYMKNDEVLFINIIQRQMDIFLFNQVGANSVHIVFLGGQVHAFFVTIAKTHSFFMMDHCD